MAAPILVQSLGVEAGDFGVVQYNVPGPPIYHERLVLIEPGASSTVSVLTPDGDDYEEDWIAGVDIVSFGLLAGGACGGAPPAGPGGAVLPVYRFRNVPTPALFNAARARAAARRGLAVPADGRQPNLAGRAVAGAAVGGGGLAGMLAVPAGAPAVAGLPAAAPAAPPGGAAPLGGLGQHGTAAPAAGDP